MKGCISFLVGLASSILILSGLCWGQCPEDQNDLGNCDTLIVCAWDADECYSFPCTVHFSLFVTHDSNTFWWVPEGKWVQDSINGFSIPLEWYHNHTNPSAYCSLYTQNNTTSFTDTTNSIFRHFREKHNRMMDLYELGGGLEWSTIILDVWNSNPGYLSLALIPSHPQNRKWWEGDTTLLATLTFALSDTMTVCIDTAFFPPGLLITFMRPDGVVYYPRINMPFCTTVGLQTFIRGDANGNGEVHIEDVVYLMNYLFLGGSPPEPLDAGDANCDQLVDIGDLVYLINYLFLGGPPPGCP